jgi:hypothetical protein
MGEKFYSNVWMKGGRELADEAIKKNERIPRSLRRSQASRKSCRAHKTHRYFNCFAASVFLWLRTNKLHLL